MIGHARHAALGTLAVALTLGGPSCQTESGSPPGTPDGAIGPVDAPGTPGEVTDGPGDAIGEADGDAPDREAPTDVGPDGAGDGASELPPERLCEPCEDDEGCGPSHDCITPGSGTGFCSRPCGGARPPCPAGARCAQLPGAGTMCAPPSGTCRDWHLGRTCREDADCGGDWSRCTAREGGRGYCTAGCSDAGDCPTGYRRCEADPSGEPLCRASWAEGPEGCGRTPTNDAGVGGGCESDADCDAERCLTESLPEPVAPFCTRSCQEDADCGEGARCRSTSVAEEPICVPAACACLGHDEGDTLRAQALEALELHPCEVLFDRHRFGYLDPSVRYDPFRLGFFEHVHDRPLELGPWVRELVTTLDELAGAGSTSPEKDATPVAALIEEQARRLDRPADPPSPPTIASDAPLVAAIASFREAVGDAPDEEALTEALAPVPEPLRPRAARVVEAMADVAEAREEALSEAPTEIAALFRNVTGSLFPTATFDRLDFTDDELVAFLNEGFGYGRLFGAARDLAAAVEETDWDPARVEASFDVVVETSAGAIVLRDAGPDVHDADDEALADGVALLLDTGGSDGYLAPVGATDGPGMPVAVGLDLGGADDYLYGESDDGLDQPDTLPDDGSGRHDPSRFEDSPFGPFSYSTTGRQGSGRLGVGLHFDLGEADDSYRSLRLSQGFAALGVGALYDAGGDDTYRCEAGCQASAMFGIGLLVDAGEGDDTRSSWNRSQGFAWLRGAGVLWDGGGADAYECVTADGNFLYPSAQRSGEGNNSMCQGFGFGRRADGSDGVSLSGGLGILRDLGGADTYTGDVFSQGGGFWFGTGVLADGGTGDDVYRGRYYAQGLAAHFGIGVLLEAGGDDRYNPDTSPPSSVGFAHDASTTLFVDRGGDDLYRGASMESNAAGMSLVVEEGGDDTYAPSSDSLGRAALKSYGDNFPEMLALGLFVDAGGNDAYEADFPGGVEPGDETSWSWKALDDVLPGELGVGLDGEGASGFGPTGASGTE